MVLDEIFKDCLIGGIRLSQVGAKSVGQGDVVRFVRLANDSQGTIEYLRGKEIGFSGLFRVKFAFGLTKAVEFDWPINSGAEGGFGFIGGGHSQKPAGRGQHAGKKKEARHG